MMFWQGLFKQAASTISQLMIFNSENEFGSQKQNTQTQTRRHTKTKRRPFQSTLAWNFTAAALYILQHRAFEKREDKNETFEDWTKKHRAQPKFPYWSCVLELELSILQFTQSIRTAYFNQFIQTLTKLLHVVVVVLPLTTSTTPDGYQCTFVTYVSIRRHHQCIKPFAMVDLLCTST